MQTLYVVFLVPSISDSGFGLHSCKHNRNIGGLSQPDCNIIVFLSVCFAAQEVLQVG